MKKRYLAFLILSTCVNPLWSDATTLGETAFLQQLLIEESVSSKTCPRAFSVAARGFYQTQATVDDSPGGDLSYGEAEVDLMYTRQLTTREGCSYIVGVDRERLDWNNNPFFNQKNFRGLDVGILAYTTRFNRWLWQGGLGAQFSLDFGQVGRYTRYTALLWGRYAYTKTIGLHAGFYAFYNLRKNQVYPILGLDWHPWDRWLFNIVFPMNVSAYYLINCQWSLGLAWRPVWSRHRIGRKDNPALPKGIWQIRGNGTELALNYANGSLVANLFVGISYGGQLKIMDYNGNNPSYYDYGMSPYAGLRFIAPF